MKNTYKLIGLIGTFVLLLSVTGCLNDDNKIPENCFDGILNNGEERIDCGGVNCPLCDPCENGAWDPLLGETWVDCGGSCDPCPQESNGIQDGDEEGIDCGGSTLVPCGALCGDGLLNGNEEDIDCGGDCDPCPTCVDGMLNGDEIGIDCGGPDCPDCATDGDCTNGEVDGDEEYIDCGGTICEPCEEFIDYKIGGLEISSLGGITGTFDGGTNTITLTGTTTTGITVTIILNQPLSGWPAMPENGASYTLNAVNVTQGVIAVEVAGVTYSTAFDGSNGSVNLSYVDAQAGGAIAGSFSGLLKNMDDSDTQNLSNGSFVVLLND